MGNKPSFSVMTDVSNSMSLNEVERSYYNKMYCQRRKSLDEFKVEMRSFLKRTGTLPYAWVK